MAYSLTDAQRAILGREMQPGEIDNWVAGVVDRGDAAAVEAKIAIIAASQSSHPYDEMRRRTYPSIGDQLDDFYREGAFSDEMAAQLQAVKDAHPKP